MLDIPLQRAAPCRTYREVWKPWAPFLPTALQVAQKFQSCRQTVNNKAQGWKVWWYIIPMKHLSPHKAGTNQLHPNPTRPLGNDFWFATNLIPNTEEGPCFKDLVVKQQKELY